MATGGVIARKTDDGFEGRYHHWDSYPEALGKTLFGLYNGHFEKDLDAMLKVLLDEHWGGWSTINGYPNGAECYCHQYPDREPGEKVDKMTIDDDWGGEYAYMFDEKEQTMYIMSSYSNCW